MEQFGLIDMTQQGTQGGQNQEFQLNQIIEDVKKDIIPPAKFTEIFKEALQWKPMEDVINEAIDKRVQSNWRNTALGAFSDIRKFGKFIATVIITAAVSIYGTLHYSSSTPTQQSNVETQQAK